MIEGLAHVAIKTGDLEATARFYSEVLGMVRAERPDFGFPGIWLAAPGPANDLVHLYGGNPARGSGGQVPLGSAAVDHIALQARGFEAFRERFQRMGQVWREQRVPGEKLWQLFLYDPNGVMIELNFDGSQEPGDGPEENSPRHYVPGENFFNQSPP